MRSCAHAREHRCTYGQTPSQGEPVGGVRPRPCPPSPGPRPHALELNLDAPLSQRWAGGKLAARTQRLCPPHQAAPLTGSGVAWLRQHRMGPRNRSTGRPCACGQWGRPAGQVFPSRGVGPAPRGALQSRTPCWQPVSAASPHLAPPPGHGGRTGRAPGPAQRERLGGGPGGRPVLVGGRRGPHHRADSSAYPSACPRTQALI